MIGSIAFPLPSPLLKIQPLSEPRPQKIYKDGEVTDLPKTNEKGQPLYGFSVAVHHPLLGGTVGDARISTPLAELPATEFGEVLELENAVVTVRNQRNEFNLAISVEANGLAGGKSLPLLPKHD